jgi:hypothetical protein
LCEFFSSNHFIVKLCNYRLSPEENTSWRKFEKFARDFVITSSVKIPQILHLNACVRANFLFLKKCLKKKFNKESYQNMIFKIDIKNLFSISNCFTEVIFFYFKSMKISIWIYEKTKKRLQKKVNKIFHFLVDYKTKHLLHLVFLLILTIFVNQFFLSRSSW